MQVRPPCFEHNLLPNIFGTGNFLGPLLFKPQDAPRYASGFLTVVITGIVGVLLMVVYRYVCVWDNHRRDKSGVLEAYEHAYEDDLTDRKVWPHRHQVLVCARRHYADF